MMKKQIACFCFVAAIALTGHARDEGKAFTLPSGSKIKGHQATLDSSVAAVSNNIIPDPEFGYSAMGSGTATNMYRGGWLQYHKPWVYNRIAIRVQTRTASPEMSLLLYQPTNGVFGDTGILMDSYTGVVVSASQTTMIFSNASPVSMAKGHFMVLWGKKEGAGQFDLRTYAHGLIPLRTSSIPSGQAPVEFSSTNKTSDIMAKFDSVGTTQSGTNDYTPIIRAWLE